MDFYIALEDVASQYLSIFIFGFYILGSLHEGRGLINIVNQVIIAKFLKPLNGAALWIFHVLKTWIPGFFSILFRVSLSCSLCLWRELKQKKGKTLLEWTWWAITTLFVFYQKTITVSKVILEKTRKHIVFIWFLRCLAKVWELIYCGVRALASFCIRKQIKTQPSSRTEAFSLELPTPVLSGRQQFSNLMCTRAGFGHCKRPSSRSHFHQIPGKACKSKRGIQEP